MKLPIALSNRHLHLSQEDINILFGKDYELKIAKPLSQPGQYACEEKVDIVGPKGLLKGVRVLGPARLETQIEVSVADARLLGVQAVIKESGDLEGSPGAKVIGPVGEIELSKGVIVAARHIHMHTDDAMKFDVKDKEVVNIETFGERSMIFKNVMVRVSPNYILEMHVDVEEGNAGSIKNGDLVELIKIC
ncbi:MAG: phosphate propanoyltransferase [Filifactoraceae bacterium]